MKRKVVTVVLAMAMVFPTTVGASTYNNNDVDFGTYEEKDVKPNATASVTSHTESEDVHNDTPYTVVEPKDYKSDFKPKVDFFKCVGNSSTSLTFALATNYSKTTVKNGVVVKSLVKPDGIHVEYTDTETGETKTTNWSPSSLNSIRLALESKVAYKNNKPYYVKNDYLANGITSGGTVSGGYTLTGLTPGHKYSVKITVWTKGSHNLYHYYKDDEGKTHYTSCTYFDNYESAPYTATSTATASTAPKKGDLGVEPVSTRFTGTDATYQTVYITWNRNAGIDKYNYILSTMNSNGKLVESKLNYRGDENPTTAGYASGMYVKVKSNAVSKITVYSTGSVYGLKREVNKLGSSKTKSEVYKWYSAPSTDKSSAKAIEIIPQVQVRSAINKDNKIKVTWSKITGLASGDKYVVYCSAKNNMKSFKKVATVGQGTTSYNITKVGNSKIDSKCNYYVYVVAVDSSVDLPDDDVDVSVSANKAQSFVNYSFRATKTGKPSLVGKN